MSVVADGVRNLKLRVDGCVVGTCPHSVWVECGLCILYGLSVGYAFCMG